MSIDRVKQYLSSFGMAEGVLEFSVSSATVSQAAEAVGVIPARIAKTLSLRNGPGALLVVAAGDTRIDNAKYKQRFGVKAAMLHPDQALAMTGHAVGGVCPFDLPPDVEVYLDVSLQRFDTVFPACGSANSAIELTCAQLEACSRAVDWVDVCKLIEEDAAPAQAHTEGSC